MSYETAQDFILSLAFSHVGPMLRRQPGGDDAERETLRLAVAEAQAAFEQAEDLLGVRPPSDSRPAMAVTDAETALAEFESRANAPLGLSDLLTPIGVRQEFEKSPIPEQRRILRQIVKQVVLSPGRGDPGNRIVVEFVDGSRWPAEPIETAPVPKR